MSNVSVLLARIAAAADELERRTKDVPDVGPALRDLRWAVHNLRNELE